MVNNKNHSILFDNIIFSLQKAGGISVYWSELLKRFIRDQYNLEIHEYLGAQNNLFRQDIDISTNQIINHSQLSLAIERYLPFLHSNKSHSIFHSSYYRFPLFFSGRVITTVFDFTYEKYKNGLGRYVHSLQKHMALSHSDGVICISTSTKNDLFDFMPTYPAERVQVIPLSYSSEFSCPDQIKHDGGEFFFTQPYLVFVGERSGYKNFSYVIEAMKYLDDYHLVIIGGGSIETIQNELNSVCKGRYSHFQGLTNKKLNSLYHRAHALIYPSAYEGFGLPVLEAMASGCPVIACNSSSIPEVAGNAGLLLDQINAAKIVEKVHALSHVETRAVQIQLGLNNIKRFDWEICYQSTLSFYAAIQNMPKLNKT